VRDSILWDNTASSGHEISLNRSAKVTARYSVVQGGASEALVGAGCVVDLDSTVIDADPLFVTGPLGEYYLSQVASGQSMESPCVDAGSNRAAGLGLDHLTTRTDGIPDDGIVDMGYHYPTSIPVLYRIEKTDRDIAIHWNRLLGVSYVIQHSTDMENWTAVPVGETDTWTDYGVSETEKYYRVFEQ